jgi:hypothetical protein
MDTFLNKVMSIISGCTSRGDLSGKNTYSRMEAIGNDDHQNASATWTENSKEEKILTYKTILKPIWIYGIQLWGTASTSNIEVLEYFQSKVLHMIVDAPTTSEV